MLRVEWDRISDNRHRCRIRFSDKLPGYKPTSVIAGAVVRREGWTFRDERWEWEPYERASRFCAGWDQAEPFIGTLAGVKNEIEARMFVALVGSRSAQSDMVNELLREAEAKPRT